MLGIVGMLTGWAAAQATPKTVLLALSKQGHTLSIIDPATLKIVGTVPGWRRSA
jgi:hypothetical protein